MGLDMYLYAEKYISGASWSSEEEKSLNQKIREVIPEMYESGNLNSIEIKFEIGYWRKANQIHNWFVDEVQDGVDECQKSYVSRDQLRELREICKTVLKESKLIKGKVKRGAILEDGEWKPIMRDGQKIEDPEKARELLPTQSGFFFGSTDYDDGYYNDIKYTIKVIEKALELPKEWDFYYRSSW